VLQHPLCQGLIRTEYCIFHAVVCGSKNQSNIVIPSDLWERLGIPAINSKSYAFHVVCGWRISACVNLKVEPAGILEKLLLGVK
jgi:hypothetical protein